MSHRPIYINFSAASERCPKPQTEYLERFHRSLPGYASTPLVSLPELATELGVQAVFAKDESNRLGLPSFKVLGASWGCYRAIVSCLGLPPTVTLDEVKARVQGGSITLIAATEGNHGRAVAFMARVLSVSAQIFVPQSMDGETRGRIASESARVVVVQGDYDQAVQKAFNKAQTTEGMLLIQDTAFEGYEEIPSWIVEGYSTILNEVEEQLAHIGLRNSLTFTPVGVGSLAHAVTRHCKSREFPISVVAVESDSAPCLTSSLNAVQVKTVPTSSTIMDGMNCGTVSSTAWPDLQRLVDASITVSCRESHEAVQYFFAHAIPAGPCGGASLAALRRLSTLKEARSILHRDSVVVLLSTEGARPYPTPVDAFTEDPTSRLGC